MYTYVLELRFVLAAYCKSIPCFLITFHFSMILYDICILLCHIYKKIIIPEQNYTIVSMVLNLCLDILTRSNTLKLFVFLNVLTRNFSSQLLNNHVIIDYKTMIVL